MSSFLKQFSRGVSLDHAEIPNIFQTWRFLNIALHNFTNEILGTWVRYVPVVVPQPNLVSSFLKQFSKGVSLEHAENLNIFETMGFWNISLHNFTNKILGTWFKHVPIVAGQPNFVSSFLKQLSTRVFSNISEFSNNFETIGF